MVRVFYGWENDNGGTVAAKSLLNLFNKPAEYILIVTNDMFEALIAFLRAKGWVYLVKRRTRDVVIALRYNTRTRTL